MKNEEITVALAGNPNVGKSTVFNSLTGMKQHTGNWTGKTVDLASGKVERNGRIYNFVDIPGTYSLKPHSLEETVADDFISFGGADKVIVVCDATSLIRNLYFVLQIIETGADVVVCLNLLDEAKKKGIHINIPLLEKELGVRVVGTSARDGEGIEELLNSLEDNSSRKSFKLRYNEFIENSLELIMPTIKKYKIKDIDERFLALRLFDKDKRVVEYILNSKNLTDAQKETLFLKAKKARNYYFENVKDEKNDIDEEISSEIYYWANKIGEAVMLSKKPLDKLTKGEKIFTKGFTAYFVMFLMLCVIFYITIVGANYPSEWLSSFFTWCEKGLLTLAERMNLPYFIQGIFILGGFRVLGWVVAVMLPPMAIFFPCFTFLEDLGVLPRVAYSLDNSFGKAQTCGKQALTTCMAYGCNCVGIAGARIIDSKRERLIAIITNSLTPCNGRFPAILKLITIFFVIGAENSKYNSFLCAIILALVIVLSLMLTLFVSNILSKTLLKGESSHYILELPPFRTPKISQVLVNSVLNRTLLVLFRAVVVAFPAGILIWLFANIKIGDGNILTAIIRFFEPLGRIMGLDGETLSAFFLGLPANEIVLPVALMNYMGAGELTAVENSVEISKILIQNNWTVVTAICYIVFSVVHFPCATSLITIYKETKSAKWTFVSFLLPTILGIILCCIINLVSMIFI